MKKFISTLFTLLFVCILSSTAQAEVTDDYEIYRMDYYLLSAAADEIITDAHYLYNNNDVICAIASNEKHSGYVKVSVNGKVIQETEFDYTAEFWITSGEPDDIVKYALPIKLTNLPKSEGDLTALELEFSFFEDSKYALIIMQEKDAIAEEPVEAEPEIIPPRVKCTNVWINSFGYISGNIRSIDVSHDDVRYEYKVVEVLSGKDVYNSSDSLISGDIFCPSSYLSSALYYVTARSVIYTETYNKVYGEWSNPVYCITAPEIKGGKTRDSISSNSITISWKKVKGATRYIIYKSNKENSGFKKVGSTTDTKLTVSNINLRNKVKYFKVVAVRNIKGKKIISKYAIPFSAEYRVY